MLERDGTNGSSSPVRKAARLDDICKADAEESGANVEEELSESSESLGESSSDGSYPALDDDDIVTILGGDAKNLTAEQKEQLQVQAHSMAPYVFPHPRLAARLPHAQLKSFGIVPVLDPDDNLDDVTALLAPVFMGQFTAGASFSPDFIADLMYHGFLPMSARERSGCILTPKLHRKRCILRFEDLHVPRKVRRRSKRLEVTVDRCFDDVVDKCIEQHGEGWLYPALVRALRAWRKSPAKNGRLGTVRLHTFEVWEDGALVAGDLGYGVGASYTSMSGFTSVDSAGSIQCVATARLLQSHGYAFWDLGMDMPYKRGLGAKPIPRMEFLSLLAGARDREPRPFTSGARNARDVIDHG